MNSMVRPSRCCRSRRRLIDLRLDRDVEGRDRLVGDDELGREREGAGDADALALAAGELVGVAVDGVGAAGRRAASALRARSSRSARVPMPWMSRPSVRISPIVMRGDRLAKGSWKMYCMRGRWRRSSAGESLVMLGAVEAEAAGGGLDQAQDGMRPMVVLPLPDSPTRPTTSPAADVEGDVLDGARRPARAKRRSGRSAWPGRGRRGAGRRSSVRAPASGCSG